MVRCEVEVKGCAGRQTGSFIVSSYSLLREVVALAVCRKVIKALKNEGCKDRREIVLRMPTLTVRC